MQGEVIKIHGVDHVILERHGLLNPKFVGRSTVDGKTHNIKLTRKGLVNHYLELAFQGTLFVCYFALFLIILAMFS